MSGRGFIRGRAPAITRSRVLDRWTATLEKTAFCADEVRHVLGLVVLWLLERVRVRRGR